MYAPTLKARDRGGAIAAVIAIHAALLFVFLHLSGTVDLSDPQAALRVFDVAEVKPPPPPVQEQVRAEPAPEEEGEAAPPNLRSQASPVVAPKPEVVIPRPPPVTASPTPNEGSERTQGAAEVPGPGTGAGGIGTGTGAGGSGSGTGGGGVGDVAIRAQLLAPRGGLRSRDFPPAMRRLLAQGRSPFVMFTVLPNGRVTNCHIYQSSGDPYVDDMTCRLVTARFVYRPAYNRRGEPVQSPMAYRQAPDR